jgi:hypothetical protein
MGFVKKTLNSMLSDSFSDKVYRRLRKEYFLGKHKKSGHGAVRNKEIASFALRYLIDIGKISTHEQLSETLQLPFFKKYVKESGQFQEELRLKIETEPKIDLSDLGELERERRIMDWAKEKVIEEETADIENAIAKKRADYDSLPSVLDTPDIKEPEVTNEDTIDVDQFIPWWKRTHMVADPFPSLDGLLQIPDEFYDSVIYKTKPFRKYEYIIENVIEELFKNTIFFGEYGSGKTTLFEYLHKILWERKIPAIYLRLFTDQSIDELMKRFMCELERELRVQLGDMIGGQPNSAAHDIKGEIIRLLGAYWELENPMGIIVFIDDLHKLPEYTQVSLDFLSYLQSFTADISKAVKGLRMSFVVAGALEWHDTVRSQAKYSGSFSNWELVEDLTVDDAHTMLNLRLAPFWPNPELERKVKREFVEQEHNFMRKNDIGLTYRNFIHRVREKFKHGDFDILSSDPTTFTEETKKGILAILEDDERLRSRFDQLLSSVTQGYNQRKTIRQLVHVFRKGGIEDEDPLLAENLFHYQKLRSAQLVQKARRKDGGFLWVVCKELVERNRLVIQKYSVSLESYLEPLYCEMRAGPVETEEELNLIANMIASSNNDDFRGQLERVKALHTLVVVEQKRFKPKMAASEIIGYCVESLETLSRAYFTYIDPIEIVLEPIRQWGRYWHFPSETRQFLKQVEEKATYERRRYPITHIYRQTFASLLGFISRQVERAKLFPIVSFDLTRSESRNLCNAEEKWMDGKYNRCADILKSLVWERMAIHISNIYHLLYGRIENQLPHFPAELRPKVLQASESGRLKSKSINYSKLSLTEMGEIVAGGHDIISYESWANVFSHILRGFNDTEVASLLQDIDTLPDFHLTPGKNAKKLKSVIWVATDLLRKMNGVYVELATEGAVIEGSGEDVSIYLCVDGELSGGLDPINCDCQEYERLRNRISNNPIPLDENKFIEESYGCNYRDFFAFLSVSIQGLSTNLCGHRWKMGVSLIRGPNLSVRVEEVQAESDTPLHSDMSKDFETQLKATEKGISGWREYEKMGVKILSFLLSPNVFTPPYAQSMTVDGRERRDAVFRLTTGANPYWDRIQTLFGTMFIVVEFKNLRRAPGRQDVRQLGDYLFVDAKRPFGILCSRKGPGDAARSARKKLWKEDRKLVIFLCDNDILEMLKLKALGQDPSKLIMLCIESFLQNLTP